MIKQSGPNSFSALFKKFRLRSEIETISEFTDIMANSGLVYDNSLFSHWQNGSRVPKDRKLLIAIAQIFINRGGITQISEINSILESAGQGNLTFVEENSLPSTLKKSPPFMAPQKPENIVRRQPLIEKAEKILEKDKILLLTGPAGCGKTITAIELAYNLRDKFKDGVVWFKVDNNDNLNILYTIAFLYHFRINHISDTQSISPLIRSLLHLKNILYIFDDAKIHIDLEPLLPSSPKSAVIITSNKILSSYVSKSATLPIPPLTEHESSQIFINTLGLEFVRKNKHMIVDIYNHLDRLPLSLQIAAGQLTAQTKSLHEYISNTFSTQDLIDQSISTLSQNEILVLSVVYMLRSSNISEESITYVTALKPAESRKIIKNLNRSSLLEKSATKRYRIHQEIRDRIGKVFKKNDTLFERAITFYTELVNVFRDNNYNFPESDFITICHILDESIERKEFDLAIKIFEPFGLLLWSVGKWHLLNQYIKLILPTIDDISDTRRVIRMLCASVSWYYYWTGNLEIAHDHILYAVELAKNLGDMYYINLANERLARTYHGLKKYSESEAIIKSVIKYYKATGSEHLPNARRYLAELYLITGKIDKANKILKNLVKITNYQKVKFNYTNETQYALTECDMGLVYFLKKDYDKALTMLLNSLSKQILYNNFTVFRVWTYLAIGLVYEKLNLPGQAITNYHSAEKALVNIADIERLNHTSVWIATLDKNLKESKIITQLDNLVKLITK